MPMSSNLTDFSQVGAWRSEVERSRRAAEVQWPAWQENLDYYTGKSKDAKAANDAGSDYVNVNADFTNVEVKQAQLFFDTPELRLSARGEFRNPPPAAQVPGAPPQPPPSALPIISAHRQLLNVLLGRDEADVLSIVQKAIKDCLCTAGIGATKICYEAAVNDVEPPEQYGSVLGLNAPISVPVDEQWQWFRVPSKKFRIPADFADTDYDKAPWLGMDFRIPLNQARATLNLPEGFTGTQQSDDKVLESELAMAREGTTLPYVDGTEVWYYASIFDPDVRNPRLIRRHVLIDGLDGFAERDTKNPYQDLLGNGRLSADSMIGYPIHALVIRDVPDSAYVPSDSTMTRGLVRELCTFRTQQVKERDANLPRVGYDVEKVPPETIAKIEAGTIGTMVPFPADVLMQGMQTVMAQITQGSQTRGAYTANDYIQRDLDRTLGIDATGSGIKGPGGTTATEIGVVDRARNVRLDHERQRVLAWYLKGVQKFSALVCRYMTPQLAVPYIGQQAANTWAQWDKKRWDGRFVFDARPDSAIKLDAAAERKFALDLYQFTAKDPNVNRIPQLKHLFELAGHDPGESVVEQLPEKKPDSPNIGFTFKGDDFLGPQAQQVRDILAQSGIKISQESIDASATQLFQQMQMGIRDASGQMIKPSAHLASHGGPVEQTRPLDQQSADTAGQTRTGPSAMTGAR